MTRILFILLLFISGGVTGQTLSKPVIATQGIGSRSPFVDVENRNAVHHQIWDEIDDFVDGFARVFSHNKFSFVNGNGSLIFPVELEDARTFVNHLAAVKKDRKWGFINESGKVIVPFRYDIVFDFKEMTTAVMLNNTWWLIDTRGIIIKQLDISVFYGFNKGIAKINRNGKTGFINTKGEIVYDEASKFNQPVTKAPLFHNNNVPNNINSVCPDNIDLEFGNFFNWNCFIGQVDTIGTTNVITVFPSPPIVGRHTIITKSTPSAIDFYGLFPTNPPDGSNFAVKLGNTNVGAQAERIQYVIKVPLNDSNFSIVYDYAVVFQNPNHTPWTQPRFTAKLLDSATNTYLPCSSFEYISTSGLPGFAISPTDVSVIYKPWSSVFISLRAYLGKTIYLEFTTADCARGAHWGYAYVDVEKTCGQSIQAQYNCTTPATVTLTGPPGFQSYNWWNQNYSALLGTGQQVVLNPAPPVNSIIRLEMIPFANFGCTDTLSVKLTGNAAVHFDASDTIGICAPHSFTFYNRTLPSTSTTWDFGDGTTGTGDTVTHVYLLPGVYVVKLNVTTASGCGGITQQTITVLQPSGSFSYTGGSFCNNHQVRFDALMNNADSLFYDFGDGTVLHTALTTIYHTYSSPGIFIPKLTIHSNAGCGILIPGPDTIKIEKLRPGFSITQQNGCGIAPVNFTDTSYSFFGITAHNWSFGDGTTGTGSTITHNFTITGTYIVRLIITGVSGCTDTISKPVFVHVNNHPVTSIIGDTTACILTSLTFNGVVQSADSVNLRNWFASNGVSGSGGNFNLSFSLPGTYNIMFVAGTINGCFDTSNHPVVISAAGNVVQPASQLACNGSATAPVNFVSSVSGTLFSWTNSNPSIGLAASGTGNIAPFIAINTSSIPVIATIIVTPINSCPGPSQTFTITVNPTPDVMQPPVQTTCNGAATTLIIFTGSVTGTSFSWTNSNPSIGLAANGTGNIASFSAINVSTVPVIATITVTPTANGCPGNSKTFTITVNPGADVAPVAGQTVCNGSATSPINFVSSVSGTLFSWTNSNPSIGLSATGTGNIASFIAINTSTVPVIATIIVTPINGCTGASQTFTITVNPTPDVVPTPGQTICNRTSTTSILFAGSVAGTSFNWTNSNPSIGLAASGSGNIASFIGINMDTFPKTATITVLPTANGCPGIARTFTIKVNPTPVVVQPQPQVVCNGSSTKAVSFTSAVGGSSFNWTNSDPSIGLAANGSGDIAPFLAINAGTSPVTAIITVSAIANGCSGPVQTFTITVNPTPVAGSVLTQTFCNGTITNQINFTSQVSNSSFSWSNSNPAIGLAASGAGSIPSFTATNTSSVPVTATITVSVSAYGCPGPVSIFLIKVDPSPALTAPANQVICNNAATAVVIFVSTVNGTTFNWTNSNPSIGLGAMGTGNIPSFIAINTSAVPVMATVTVTPVANGCPGQPKTFSFTVKSTPQVTQSANQSVCNGTNTATVNFTSTLPNTSFNWTNTNSSIGLAASGTGNIPSFIAINSSLVPQTASISVLPSANGCNGPADIFMITVHPTPVVVTSNDMNLCFGSAASLSTNGAQQYLWSPAIGLSCTNCPNPTASPTATTQYIVKGTSLAGCSGYDTVIIKVIQPFPMIVKPNDTICVGSSVRLGASGGKNYLWSPSTGLNHDNVAAPNASPLVTTRYRVIGYDGYNCFADTGYVVVTVGPQPVVKIGPDLTLSTGSIVNLQPVIQNGPIRDWLWTPSTGLNCTNCPSPQVTVSNNISYQLSVTNVYGCKATSNIFINVFCKNAQVFVPNAFTPDGDGLNDVLIVRGKGVNVKSFRIFNRWGELVFEKLNFLPNDARFGWDGKIRGIPATPDVFVFTVDVICDNGITYTYKGNTTLLK